ncbi:eukaryotic aspartyl protease family protein [Striga asiatica]|uniref:Eukaryotic aspartyl protease family protein n=1 Tax=Striga asiatica TaxID=4170 RepID=A0A5A7P7Z8_STRAF|nr:eukaryotic aspartyl protease family protein [Striga asiatica]
MESLSLLSVLALLFSIQLMWAVTGNIVFRVNHKYGGRSNKALGELRAHDARRHGRMLAALDFPLGGDGSPTGAALYFTKVTIGTPPVDYHVQVDTGSDILWVNCQNCQRCPAKSDLKISLKRYDLSASSTGELISCDDDFCTIAVDLHNSDCKKGMNCEYFVAYGDGSRTEGYFVRDQFRLDQVSGDLQTSTMNGSISFGYSFNNYNPNTEIAPKKRWIVQCSAKQSGQLGSSSEAVDGLIGFGQANSSILSQLASAGKVKKVFSHCLDSNKGGGIFAIGEVVQPKVNRTPLVPNSYVTSIFCYNFAVSVLAIIRMQHYNVILKSVEVGGQFLNLPTDIFDAGSNRGTIIDSGTTLAYLPSVVYQQLMSKVMEQQPDLQTHVVEQQFRCLCVDDGFPVVKFHFEGSLILTVYPHEYLFEISDNEYCIGWQNSASQTKDGQDMTLLGDIVLSDKLVYYDLENQTIGWAQYNCSSSIRVKDGMTGSAYAVNAHDLSSSTLSPSKLNFVSSLLFIAVIFKLIE